MPSLAAGLLRAPLLVLLLVGCSGPPPVPLATPPLPSAASAQEPEPAGSASVAAFGSASAAPPPPAVPGGPPSWVLVEEVSSATRLFAIQGALVLAPEGPNFGWTEENNETKKTLLTVVRNGKTETLPPLEGGRGFGVRQVSVHGRWPDHIDIFGIVDESRMSYPERYTLGASGWTRRSAGCPQGCQSDTRWSVETRQVGPRIVSRVVGRSGPPRFQTAWGSAISPRLTPAPKECLSGEEPPTVLLWPDTFGGLADGTLITAGTTCTGEAMTEIWKPGESTSTLVKLTTLPGSEPLTAVGGTIVTGLVGEAWLLGQRTFHYEKGAWQEIPMPEGESFTGGTMSRDGTLWAIWTEERMNTIEGKLWKRSGGGWSQVSVPGEFVPEALAATDDGEVWTLGRGLLLRQMHPGETPLAALPPPREDGYRIPPKKPRVTAGSEKCHTNLVVLFGFTRVTPEDYTFPLTGKALKGHTEFEEVGFAITRDGGKKYLSAQVSSYGIGKKLASLIEKKIAGSRPQIVCAEPEIVRKLDLDAAAGELKNPE